MAENVYPQPAVYYAVTNPAAWSPYLPSNVATGTQQQQVQAAGQQQQQQQQYDPSRDPNNKPGWADYFDPQTGQWHYSVDEHMRSLGYNTGGGGGGAAATGTTTTPVAMPTAPAYPGQGMDWLTWQTLGGQPAANVGGGVNPFPNPGDGFVPWSNLDDAGVQRNLAYWNSALPWQQFAQNNYQYGNDFVESKRRFDEQFAETKNNNLFNQKATAWGTAARGYLPNARGWVYNG